MLGGGVWVGRCETGRGNNATTASYRRHTADLCVCSWTAGWTHVSMFITLRLDRADHWALQRGVSVDDDSNSSGREFIRTDIIVDSGSSRYVGLGCCAYIWSSKPLGTQSLAGGVDSRSRHSIVRYSSLSLYLTVWYGLARGSVSRVLTATSFVFCSLHASLNNSQQTNKTPWKKLGLVFYQKSSSL